MSSGVWMAATEPVTPKSTLAMALLPMQSFDGIEQAGRQVAAADPYIPCLRGPLTPIPSPPRRGRGQNRRPSGAWSQERPRGSAFQRVGYHQVGGRLPTRALGDVAQLLLTQPDFELEFDEDAAKAPVAANAID